jgi:hypothetical protein
MNASTVAGIESNCLDLPKKKKLVRTMRKKGIEKRINARRNLLFLDR